MYKLICSTLLSLFTGIIHANNLYYETLAANTQTAILHESSDQAASYTEYAAVVAA